MGKNGCGPNDGALFGVPRYGVGPTQYTASLCRAADWAVLQIRLHQREAIFAEQPDGPKTRGVGSARFSTRTGATQAKASPISGGRRKAVHPASASFFWRAPPARLGPRNV